MTDRTAKILVADDDPAISRLLATLLEADGHDVHTVGDGRSALDALAGFDPDLVILDVMMPTMDGLEVLREMRSVPGERHVPVILLTARDDTSSTWDGWRAGCDYYMPKPFDPDLLCSTVERLVHAGAGVNQ